MDNLRLIDYTLRRSVRTLSPRTPALCLLSLAWAALSLPLLWYRLNAHVTGDDNVNVVNVCCGYHMDHVHNMGGAYLGHTWGIPGVRD